MRLLVAELRAYSHYVSREFAYIMRELIDIYGWRHLDPSAVHGHSLRDAIARRCDGLPKVILFWGGEGFLCDHHREVESLPAVKWFASDDLHHHDSHGIRERAFLLCDTIFSPYAYCFAHFFPEVAQSRRIVWLPHSASPDFALPLNLQPRNQILLSGAMGKTYPLRERLNTLRENGLDGIAREPHPGYHCQYAYGSDVRVGRAFARRIWEHRAAFTDGLTFGYVVAKHFEIPATGSLLVADEAMAGPLAELGFSPGENYLPISSDNLECSILNIFCEEYHPRLDQIRKNGQTLVMERHRTSHRARLIDDLAGKAGGSMPAPDPFIFAQVNVA